MTMRKSPLVAGVLATALFACGDANFNKPSRLDKPRILAVKADPPQPSFGVTTTLSTLLYQPRRDRLDLEGKCPNPGPTTYKWSWCPIGMVADSATNTFKCPFPEEGFRQIYDGVRQSMPGLPEAPPFELGEGETMPFTNPFPAPILYALCRGDIGSSLGGTGDLTAGRSVFSCDLPAEDVASGVDIQNPANTHPIGFSIYIKVEVTPACPELLPAGFSPLIALYSLHLPTNDALPVNQNPVINGIIATENMTEVLDGSSATPAPGGDAVDGGVADGGASRPDASLDLPDGAVQLEDDPTVKVLRDKHVGLALDIAISNAERLAVPGRVDYVPVTQTQKVAMVRHFEHLTFGWYGEAGDFTGDGKGHQTGFLPEAIPYTQDPPLEPTEADQESWKFNTTNTWDLPKTEDYKYKTARIIVVVRDGRGGVDWTTKQVTLEDNR
jgi:hypothetical protein